MVAPLVTLSSFMSVLSAGGFLGMMVVMVVVLVVVAVSLLVMVRGLGLNVLFLRVNSLS